jgi:hypothetical protein
LVFVIVVVAGGAIDGRYLLFVCICQSNELSSSGRASEENKKR